MVAEQTPGEDHGEVVAAPPLWLRLGRGLGRIVLSRRFALLLVLAALGSGALTYRALTGTTALAFSAKNVQVVLLADLVLVLMLCVVVFGRVVQLWMERRRGSAGSRLHIRLATLFSVVAVAPSIIVAVFSVLFLNLGIESWFSERVRTALDESMAVAAAYINEHRQIIRADTSLAEAINYTLSQWGKLTAYLEHPQTRIDNNLTEQSIRPCKLGAKNWLFIGHPGAGHRSAVIYTLIESCRRHGIEPQAYLCDVLKKLPSMTNHQAANLTPDKWIDQDI